MIKRFLQTCAAAALMASSAFAGNATGTYSTQTTDDRLVIELRPLQDDLLRGTVHYANQDFPLIAKQVGDNVNGTWEIKGQHIPFTSSLAGQTLTLTTNGATYALEKTAEPLPDAPEIQPVPAPAAAVEIPKAETRQGRAFKFDVPQGWDARESEAGVDLVSPDGITSISHAFWFAAGQSKPQEVLSLILTQASAMKWTDVKIESSTPRDQNGALGTKYNLSYKFNGTPVRAEMVIVVYNEAKRNVDRIVVLQARPDVFERNEKAMMELAHKVEVTHAELIDPGMKQPQPQDPADITPADPKAPDAVTPAYKAHQEKMDEAANQFDQIIRGQDRSDPR